MWGFPRLDAIILVIVAAWVLVALLGAVLCRAAAMGDAVMRGSDAGRAIPPSDPSQ
jgi:hypothetical protein